MPTAVRATHTHTHTHTPSLSHTHTHTHTHTSSHSHLNKRVVAHTRSMQRGHCGEKARVLNLLDSLADAQHDRRVEEGHDDVGVVCVCGGVMRVF